MRHVRSGPVFEAARRRGVEDAVVVDVSGKVRFAGESHSLVRAQGDSRADEMIVDEVSSEPGFVGRMMDLVDVERQFDVRRCQEEHVSQVVVVLDDVMEVPG